MVDVLLSTDLSLFFLLLQLTWFMTTSLQTRNYFVGHSGDTYLRLMLFWAIFMPMDEHFSLDRIRKRHSFGRHNTHRSRMFADVHLA